MFKAAVSKVDITPPAGVRMAGFDDTVSLAVHDPLWARCLVLDDGVSSVALVSTDLLFAERDIVKTVRAQVSSSTRIPPDAILIAGTHTHSGPARAGDDATSDEKSYWDELPGRLIGLIKETASQLQPAKISAASGWAAIGINRREKTPCGQIILGRNEFGTFDPELGVVRVDRTDGAPLAALLNFACHGVCLMHDNRLISGDYPGYAVRLLEERLGGATALFFNGAAGNINPREVMQVGGDRTVVGNFLVAGRAGEALAAEAERVWPEAAAIESPTLSYVVRTVELPAGGEGAVRRSEARLRQAERQDEDSGGQDRDGMVARARRLLKRVREGADTPTRADVQVLAVGPLAFVGWPCEAFCELGMALKRRSPFETTYVLGYANGSIGYVPTRAAFAEGGYEVEQADELADDAGEALVKESAALLNELRRKLTA